MEAGESQIFTFNTFQSTYDTHNNLDIELQDRMRNPMAFLDDIQGDMMHIHQVIDQ